MGYDSSDIVPCLIEQTMIAIILIHHNDNTLKFYCQCVFAIFSKKHLAFLQY